MLRKNALEKAIEQQHVLMTSPVKQMAHYPTDIHNFKVFTQTG